VDQGLEPRVLAALVLLLLDRLGHVRVALDVLPGLEEEITPHPDHGQNDHGHNETLDEPLAPLLRLLLGLPALDDLARRPLADAPRIDIAERPLAIQAGLPFGQ
jgi:hypothetical protein